MILFFILFILGILAKENSKLNYKCYEKSSDCKSCLI